MNRAALLALSRDDLIALILAQQTQIDAQARQISSLTARMAGLEVRRAAPGKTPDNSSLPPSKGEKPNRPDHPKKPRHGRPGNPKVVIEAKLTEDDGPARDKVTRVQHLGALGMKGKLSHEEPHFEVIACIAGRGFKVRREDMKKLLIATRSKVFTLETIRQMVEHARLADFVINDHRR